VINRKFLSHRQLTIESIKEIAWQFQGVPFLVQMCGVMETRNDVCILFEYVPGGSVIRAQKELGSFTESQVKFYEAEVLIALCRIHERGFIHRKLSGENVLIDAEGHVKLSGFLTSTDKTICGNPEYLAPEKLQNIECSQAVDFWSFGVLIYQLFTGTLPFAEGEKKSWEEIARNVIQKEPPYIGRFGACGLDLIRKLLDKNPRKRLKAEEIKNHDWFQGINWKKVAARKGHPAWIPKVKVVEQAILQANMRPIPRVPEFNEEEQARYFDGFSAMFT
jgi:protein-serine/threonine kinase